MSEQVTGEITLIGNLSGQLNSGAGISGTLTPISPVTDNDGNLTVNLDAIAEDGVLTILDGAFTANDGNIEAQLTVENAEVVGVLSEAESLSGALSAINAITGIITVPTAFIPSNYGLITWNGSVLTVS